MQRHWIYDQWGPAQKIPVAICGIVGIVLLIWFLPGQSGNVEWAIIGSLILAVVNSIQRCGHLALRINDLEVRLDKYETSVSKASSD